MVDFYPVTPPLSTGLVLDEPVRAGRADSITQYIGLNFGSTPWSNSHSISSCHQSDFACLLDLRGAGSITMLFFGFLAASNAAFW